MCTEILFSNKRLPGRDSCFLKPGNRPNRSRGIGCWLATEQAGITGTVGWHTFRRSISTWLIDNDENVKVTQELMRHSHSKTTLDIYAKAVTPSKRRAHERIVDGLLAAADRNVGLAAEAEITNVG